MVRNTVACERKRAVYDKHGFGYTSSVMHHGIERKWCSLFGDDSVKISILKLKNQSQENRGLSLTYYIRPVLGVSDQFTAMHINTKADNGMIVIKNNLMTSFPAELPSLILH